MDTNTAKSVLNNIYLNAKTGSRGINDLMPKADSADFLAQLKAQDDTYRTIQQEAANQLIQMGEAPTDIGPLKKASMWASVNLNTLVNSDTSHLAELMITGSTMGITQMTKVLNGYQNPDPQIKALGDRLVQTQQQHIDQLKTYLH